MRILTKYILRESLASFLLAMLLFTFILLMNRIFDLVNMVISKGVGLAAVGKLLSYTLPFTLTLSLPMATLLAILLALGRLNQDNEITAIKASGVSTLRLMTPLLITCVLLSLVGVYFNDWVVPAANHKFKNLYMEIIYRQPVLKLEERTFIELQDTRLYFESIDKKASTFKGVIIYRNEKDGLPLMITAQDGNFHSDQKQGLVLELHNGARHMVDKNDFLKYNRIFFKTYSMLINLAQDAPKDAIRYKSLREMNKNELGTEIQRLRDSNIKHNTLLVEYHLRNVIPFACLTFALIAIPLGLRPKQTTKGLGFGMSLILIIVYYTILISGMTAGERGMIKPAIAIWLPNLLIGFAGILFSIKVIRGKV
ncbi:MAG: LPS export ABC transporter permease LptF [bacterium]|nr:LPS export ABC transporter permease LptF [bacterium]